MVMVEAAPELNQRARGKTGNKALNCSVTGENIPIHSFTSLGKFKLTSQLTDMFPEVKKRRDHRIPKKLDKTHVDKVRT